MAHNILCRGSKMTSRYNLRGRKDDVLWVKDDTMTPNEDDEDSEYESEEDEEMGDEEITAVIKIPRRTRSIDFIIRTTIGEEESSEDEFVEQIKKHSKSSDSLSSHMELTSGEREYFDVLSRAKKRELNSKMKALSSLTHAGDVPQKFRILDLPIAEQVKSDVIKKIDALEGMDPGEQYKQRNWIDNFMRIPFGVVIPLPVKFDDGPEPCANFLKNARATMDKAVYGMAPAKTQIMQILAQWIANPKSTGNVIAMKGPMGVGKTSFARNGISSVLQRPFQFFSLGGASDASTFVGHSFTYEGSMCGRIAESLMQSHCMNPVLYFDELDKISTTPHGEEIVGMLIHLTDRSQNSQFHDKYFAGVDFDLSQCLFVFSFNDESKIHPILRDRLQVINCLGYTSEDKTAILTKYIWPGLLGQLNFKADDLLLTKEALKYLIEEYSSEEDGVRNLIRAAEMLITRINLLRITDPDTRKSYKFGADIVYPCAVTEDLVKHILQDSAPKRDETWRSLYN